jgi:hypothetical protein
MRRGVIVRIARITRMRQLARGSLRIAIMAIAVVMVVGIGVGRAAQAAPANHGPGAVLRPVAGPSRGQAAGHASGDKQCFYTFPNCSSTNPTAQFTIVSSGDTSSCVFQYTTGWGDGTTETQSFRGRTCSGTVSYAKAVRRGQDGC